MPKRAWRKEDLYQCGSQNKQCSVPGRDRCTQCPLCVCWDTKVAKQGRGTCTEILNTFTSKNKKYFDDWEYSEDTLKTHQLDDEKWLNSLRGWVAEGRARRGESYDSVTPLGELEDTSVSMLDKLIEDVRLWKPHWILRNAIFNALHDDLSSQEPGHVFIWMDWMDSHISYK